jgi:vanillate/3-O-methylgallate O-demethylase
MAQNLDQILEAAGGPVELLRHSQAGPNVYPGVQPEYTNWRDEQWAWQNTAILFNQSYHMADLLVEGPDALKLLSYLGVNSVKGFTVNKAKQFVPVNYDGYVIGDVILFYLAENTFNLVGRAPVLEWVTFHAETGGYDVKVTLDQRWALRTDGKRLNYRFQVQGPNAFKVMDKAMGGNVPDLKFFNMADVVIAGKTVGALRHGMAGQPGYELYGPWEDYDAVHSALVEAGKEFGMRLSGGRAYSSNTLESAWIPSPLPAVFSGEKMKPFREWLGENSYEAKASLGGSFYSDNIEDYYLTPWDIGYGIIVKFDHDFIGREALEKIAAEGPKRKKVTLVLNEEDLENKVFASYLQKDELPAKFMEFPSSVYSMHPFDKVTKDGKTIGLSTWVGFLHVADEGREPRALQGRRARLPGRVGDDRGPEAGRAGARPEPLHRAGRQHLLPGQDRRHRRQELPADGRLHDRHERRGLPRHDGRRRPSATWTGKDDKVNGPHHRLRLHLARARHRRGHGPRQDQEPYWQKVFSGYEFSRQWIKDNKPDVVFLVFNDHATAFSLEMIPTFAIGTAAEYAVADEGWGPRPVPKVEGAPGPGRAHRALGDPAGLRPHHRQQDGRRPRPHRAAVADVRPAQGVAVQGDPVRRQRGAVPGAQRHALLQAGQAIRKAVESFDEDLNVQIWGTGGMSHQLQGPRAGLINGQDRRLRPRHRPQLLLGEDGAAPAARRSPWSSRRRANSRCRSAANCLALRQGRRAHRHLRRRHGCVRERRALSHGAHIVVGTPGRLRDHLERGALDLSALLKAVLDEADEMLDMGFREDLEEILDATPDPSAARCCSRRRCPSRSSRSPSAISATRCASRPSARIAAMATSPIRRSPVAPSDIEHAVDQPAAPARGRDGDAVLRDARQCPPSPRQPGRARLRRRRAVGRA